MALQRAVETAEDIAVTNMWMFVCWLPQGTGRLAGPHAVQVHPIDAGDPQMLTAKNVILATGSEPAPLVGGALEVCSLRRVSGFRCSSVRVC